jgi:hypothetical protein
MERHAASHGAAGFVKTIRMGKFEALSSAARTCPAGAPWAKIRYAAHLMLVLRLLVEIASEVLSGKTENLGEGGAAACQSSPSRPQAGSRAASSNPASKKTPDGVDER